MATAFVTGATGFVGLNLIRYLRSHKWQVTCLVRQNTPVEMLKTLNVHIHYGDAANRSDVLNAMPLATDVVFPLASIRKISLDGSGKPSQFNETALRAAIFSSVEKRARCLVYLSDALVYGFSNNVFDETAAMLDPDTKITPSAYVRSKRECESILKRAAARGLDAITLNPGPIINPLLDITPALTLNQLLKKNTGMHDCTGSRCFIDIDSVVKSLVAMAERGRIGENYLLGGPSIGFQTVNTLLSEMNKRLPLVKFSSLMALTKVLPRQINTYFMVGDTETRWLAHGKQHFSSDKIQRKLAIQLPDINDIMLTIHSMKCPV